MCPPDRPRRLPRRLRRAACLCTFAIATLPAQAPLANELFGRGEAAARARDPERAAGLLRRAERLLPLIPPGPARERLQAAIDAQLTRIDPSSRVAAAAREEATRKLVEAATKAQAAGWRRTARRLADSAFRLRPDLAGDLVRELRADTPEADALRVPGVPAVGREGLAGKDGVLARHFAAALVPGPEHTWQLAADAFTSPALHDTMILGAAVHDLVRITVTIDLPAHAQGAGVVFRYLHDDDFCVALLGRHPDASRYFQLLHYRDGRFDPIGASNWITEGGEAPRMALTVTIDAGRATMSVAGKTSPPLPLPGETADGILGFCVLPSSGSALPVRFSEFALETTR